MFLLHAYYLFVISLILNSFCVKCSTKKKGTRSATTNFGKEEVLKIREGIILETLGPGGARVAFVNTIEETANAILSFESLLGRTPPLWLQIGFQVLSSATL